MDKALIDILKDFKIASYKIHVLHVGLVGINFVSIHPFLWEVYQFLEDQIDEIMENIEILWYEVPINLNSILQEESMDELDKMYSSVNDVLLFLSKTLTDLIVCTQVGIIKAWETQEYTVQNDIINYQKQIKKFEWFTRRSLWAK